ncbi:hypothetical protein V8Z74_14690 [Comamonas sp. w2-DMI]|uniref:hypothetical protein n=1 Tax=Comamonas sp. w2-DMI TaxID=3126391 RepID=UPI0032E39079
MREQSQVYDPWYPLCFGTLKGMDFYQDKTYAQAVEAVLADRSTSHYLRERLEHDKLRDPVDAMRDAEILLILAVKREQEVFDEANMMLALAAAEKRDIQ